MSFTQEYQKKLTTADEAVKVVKSGDRLEYGWCVTTPVALDEALAKRMPDLENIQIHGGIVMRPLAITQIENPADHFTWNSWHMGGLERKWINEGFSFYAPIRYSELPSYYRDCLPGTDVVMMRLHLWMLMDILTLVQVLLIQQLCLKKQNALSSKLMKICLVALVVSKKVSIFPKLT